MALIPLPSFSVTAAAEPACFLDPRRENKERLYAITCREDETIEIS